MSVKPKQVKISVVRRVVKIVVAKRVVKITAKARGPQGIPGSGGPGGSVDSVFARTGNVTAQAGDYNDTQIAVDDSDFAAQGITGSTVHQIFASIIGGFSGIVVQILDSLTTLSTSLANHISNMSNPHGVTKSQVGLGNADNTSDANKPVSGPQQTALDLKEDKANKGQANGYATLDPGGKIPVAQLPNSIMEYKGVWNASTNTPSLSNGTGDTGDVYRVTVAGTRNFGAGNISFDVGDYAVYNSSGQWEKSDTTDSVPTVFSRTGNVVAQSGDYNAGQVTNTPAGNIAATNVQAALNELDAEKQVADADLTTIAALDSTQSGVIASIGAGWIIRTYAQLKTLLALVKADVGLGNVDNTSNATERAAARTLTNARIAPRVGTLVDTASIAIDIDATESDKLLTVSQATTFTITGTPTPMQKHLIRFQSSAAWGITWPASFRNLAATAPTSTVAGKVQYMGIIWNADDTVWDVLAYGVQP